jgi:hypothetical protein
VLCVWLMLYAGKDYYPDFKDCGQDQSGH